MTSTWRREWKSSFFTAQHHIFVIGRKAKQVSTQQ